MIRTSVLIVSLFATFLASAQTPLRATVATPAMPSKAAQVQPDYQALYQREVEKNRDLKGQVASLTDRISQMTHPGGSAVQAYCETPTMSRNTAGASNDCAKNGFGCEPVSGLCRTSARSSDECAATYIYCATTGGCVRDANACPSG
ncbi:hypothetical protein DWG18_10255 [Lysobacter sp. TY2-98]|uniref:hypothetical protein n=1 Tax=Lysobacter sp. TY2-98 TaxID=2290922 RepID=UPI000E20288A|nr:hypothetical protein [Lysobacter sp. TY2-98]AXK72618.1 hypothetical protein DWG18_10255 [Lysobacter sp. TY2-98]